MDILTLRDKIKTNNLDSFYIFTGVEIGVMDVYLQQINRFSGLTLRRIDTVNNIISTLSKQSFIKQDFCYIVRDDKEFMQSEKMQTFIENNLKNNKLILILSNADKRTKFYNKYKDSIVEFEPLGEVILTKYIQKEIPLSNFNCATLIKLCDSDYCRILLEIDKIKTYNDIAYSKSQLQPPIDKAFLDLLQDGAIYKPPKDAIFDFVKAVCQGKLDCFELMEESLEYGENPLVMLSVLYTNMKQMLMVQSCNSNDISKSTGLTAWQIKCAKENIGAYSVSELVHALRIIRHAEKNIKMGVIEPLIAVNWVLVSIL